MKTKTIGEQLLGAGAPPYRVNVRPPAAPRPPVSALVRWARLFWWLAGTSAAVSLVMNLVSGAWGPWFVLLADVGDLLALVVCGALLRRVGAL